MAFHDRREAGRALASRLQWYEDFSQTSDAEVRQLLEEAARVPAGTLA